MRDEAGIPTSIEDVAEEFDVPPRIAGVALRLIGP